jgi:hypothetical protein
MRKRVFIAILAAAALLVAPVAGTDAKQDGDSGATKSKKCKPRLLGFKVNGTFGRFDVTGLSGDLTVAVEHANRHARDWLGGATSATFNLAADPEGVKIKFIGVTDNPVLTGAGTIGFEDAVTTDRVKVKAKLEELKHGCEEAVPEDDAVTEVGAEDTQLEVSTGLDVKKIKVKRPDATESD